MISTLFAFNLILTPFNKTKASINKSMSFNGTGTNYNDRIEIPVSNSSANNIGASDFAIEFWMKASAANNTPMSGAGSEWIWGNIIFDRDILDNTNDKFGISLFNGNLRFGAGSNATTIETSGVNVADNTWRFIVVNRRASDGFSTIHVDGTQRASGTTVAGDISYKSPYAYNSGGYTNCSVQNKNAFIVLGAEKHDYAFCTGADLPSRNSYRGLLDDVRISNALRTSYSRPVSELVADSQTVGLYRFNEGTGTTAIDSSISQINGVIKTGSTFSVDTPITSSSTTTIFTDTLLELYNYNSNVFISTRDTGNQIVTNTSPDLGNTWLDWEISSQSGGQMTFAEFNGTLYHSGRNTSNQIIMRTKTGLNDWSGWTNEGSLTIGKVTMVVFDCQLYQAVRRPDNAISTRFSSDGVNWSSWVNNGFTPNNVSMTVFNSRLYQAVRGNSGMIFTRYTEDGSNWTQWVGNGSTPYDVSVLSDNSRIIQAAIGNSKRIFIRYSVDGVNWTTWNAI